jgi:hypothetical protein
MIRLRQNILWNQPTSHYAEGSRRSKNNFRITLASAPLLDRFRSIRQYIKHVWEPFSSAKDESLVALVHRAASAPWLIPN